MSAPAKEVVVVTGASSGIGLATANAFLASGAHVVANARDANKLRAAFEQSTAKGRLAFVPGDVGDAATSDALVHTAVERFGRLDVVVANAGIFSAKPFTEFTGADLDAMLATSLKGTILLAQAAIRAFRARKAKGAIVSVTASIAIAPQLRLPASFPVAVKGAVNALTKALALEHASEQIRVNAVAPGIVRTPLIADPEALAGAQPMGHIGEAADVADAILYLARAPFVTGVVLPVDGGMAAGRF